MSRRIVSYIDGVAQWEDLGPADHVRLFGLGGSYRIGVRMGQP